MCQRGKSRDHGRGLLLIGIMLFLAGCGRDGTIYGSLTWDYAAFGTMGGFPSSGLVQHADYQIAPGSYQVQFYIFDGASYWPGGTYSPTYYWNGSYTVTADPGSFPFMNGADSYFSLYLSKGGLYKSGSVKAIHGPGRPPTSLTWKQDGLTITVSNEVTPIPAEALSRFENVGRR
jgi:hypothetical protein